MKKDLFYFINGMLIIGFSVFLFITFAIHLCQFKTPLHLILQDTLQTIGTYMLSAFIFHKILFKYTKAIRLF